MQSRLDNTLKYQSFESLELSLLDEKIISSAERVAKQRVQELIADFLSKQETANHLAITVIISKLLTQLEATQHFADTDAILLLLKYSKLLLLIEFQRHDLTVCHEQNLTVLLKRLATLAAKLTPEAQYLVCKIDQRINPLHQHVKQLKHEIAELMQTQNECQETIRFDKEKLLELKQSISHNIWAKQAAVRDLNNKLDSSFFVIRWLYRIGIMWGDIKIRHRTIQDLAVQLTWDQPFYTTMAAELAEKQAESVQLEKQISARQQLIHALTEEIAPLETARAATIKKPDNHLFSEPEQPPTETAINDTHQLSCISRLYHLIRDKRITVAAELTKPPIPTSPSHVN